MNYELENDEIEVNYNEDMMIYEVNGKKNYIIGKSNKFSYYCAVFWKKLLSALFANFDLFGLNLHRFRPSFRLMPHAGKAHVFVMAYKPAALASVHSCYLW